MKDIKQLSVPAAFKALDDAAGGDGQPSGRVRAVVSVFGNEDYQADVVLPGAFTDTLAAWKASGDPIPFIWSHMWDNPDAHIGVVLDARETAEGLEVDAQLDLDRPFAQQVHHLLMARRVTQFSFGYYAEEYAWVPRDDGTEIRELRKLDLFECGPTLRGMNPATRLVEAAAAPAPTVDPAPADAQQQGGRDGGGTIDAGRLADLMTMTRHKES